MTDRAERGTSERPRSPECTASLTQADLLQHALSLPGAWQDEPWENHVVTKVHDRIFAFLGALEEDADSIGVKSGATREIADEWLARFPADASVMAYIGRNGWNNLRIGGAISDEEILEAIEESYQLVVSKIPRKHRPPGWDGLSAKARIGDSDR